MKKIRVLVVDDSLTVRTRICQVLSSDPDIEVVGEATDGKRAIELCLALKPDAITLDMILPEMSGLAATEYIMAHAPTPILIVSASTNRGELFKTYDALAAGAVDVLDKPSGDMHEADWDRRLISTVKLVSRIRVITHPRARLGLLGRSSPPVIAPSLFAAQVAEPVVRRCEIIALGASTGGPRAVVDVLRALPAPYPLPLLLVLHLNRAFAAAFAEWLDAQTSHRVCYAQGGERLVDVRGRLVLAPPDQHMVVAAGRLCLSAAPERHSCRPSVDVLFESVANEHGATACGCLFSGMGRDGAAGLLAIRKRGGLTIAQDEATSTVFGMPREAILLGAAERTLPIGEIGPVLAALTGGTRST